MTKSLVNRIIKKSAVSLAALLATASLYAGSFTLTIQPNTFTNLFAFNPNIGSVLVKQVILTAPVATATSNAVLSLIDTPTNWLLFTNAAYTNTVRYATNLTTFWTNFYGVVQTNTPVGSNLVLIDITNNLVPLSSNAYPVRLTASATAGNTTTIVGAANSQNGLALYFDQGLWATNSGPAPGILTIIY